MKTPSGQIYDRMDLYILDMMAKYGFIRHQEQMFKLKSGVLSHVYVFGREDVTDHPDFEWLLGRKISLCIGENTISEDKQPCLIGIPTAGTALAQAAAMVSFTEAIRRPTGERIRICHRVMKEAQKATHGANPTWVNGKPQPNIHTYWTVDNVVTDGGSKLEATVRLRESGYPAEEMPSFILVDRQQGGIRKMEKAGFKRIVVAYKLLDLTFAFREMGLWPKSAVRAVEEEIAAHQVA